MDNKNSGILGVCLIIAALIVALMPRPAAPGTQVGRFQMSGVSGHSYVVDTSTGQVWERFTIASEGGSDPDFKDSKVK